MKIIIAGCGALGSHIALQIAREEMKFTLIDNDRVEPHNVLTGTTVYHQGHIGNKKVDALGELLYLKYRIKPLLLHVNIEAVKESRLENGNLLIDCFDNIEARGYTTGLNIPTVHVGVSPQFIGAVEWNETYEIPEIDSNENPICTHEVGRNLILLTSVVASTIIRRFLKDGIKEIAIVNNNLEIF